MIKIVTEHVHPPIPIRTMDWQAYYDGEEELGRYGSGATEQEAINDLTENHPRCKEEGGYVGSYGECCLCSADTGVACRRDGA